MGCLTLQGINSACGGSQGGIKKVYMIEYSAIESFEQTNGTVNSITYLDTSPAMTGAWYSFLKDNSNWTEAIVGDGILASIHFEPTVTLVFRKMNVETRNEIMALTAGDVVIFIEDSNGTRWMIGSDRGMSLSASSGAQSGSKLDELNGETLTFTGKETYKAYVVDDTVWNTLPV
jgi:hypothetical protein